MKLYEITRDLFTYLAAFRWKVEAGVRPTLEEIQKDLLDLFQEQEALVRANPTLSAGYEQVRYALVVFADEVILSSELDNALDWDAMLLEQRFFRTQVGGDRFFRPIEDHEITDPQVALIYHTCIVMGFKGRYDRDDEDLAYFKKQLQEILAPPSDDAQGLLCPEAYAVRTIKQSRSLPAIWKWQYLIVGLLIILAGYIFLDRVVIWRYLTSPLKQISSLATQTASIETRSPTASSALSIQLANIRTSGSGPTPIRTGGKDLHQSLKTAYTIQVMVHSDPEKAQSLTQELNALGYEAYWREDRGENGKPAYPVLVGHFETEQMDSAVQTAAVLRKKEKMQAFITPWIAPQEARVPSQ